MRSAKQILGLRNYEQKVFSSKERVNVINRKGNIIKDTKIQKVDFDNCLFREYDIDFSIVSECTFKACRIIGSRWSTFSNCLFKDCVFLDYFQNTTIRKNCKIDNVMLHKSFYESGSYFLGVKYSKIDKERTINRCSNVYIENPNVKKLFTTDLHGWRQIKHNKQ